MVDGCPLIEPGGTILPCLLSSSSSITINYPYYPLSCSRFSSFLTVELSSHSPFSFTSLHPHLHFTLHFHIIAYSFILPTFPLLTIKSPSPLFPSYLPFQLYPNLSQLSTKTRGEKRFIFFQITPTIIFLQAQGYPRPPPTPSHY